jgi:integrase
MRQTHDPKALPGKGAFEMENHRKGKYALQVCNAPSDRIFPITYEAARMMVIKSGKLVGVKLRPHDLRRHSATYASRSGVPIEIISKVILRHANLSTTQDIWERSAILKRSDGLRIFMADVKRGDAEKRFHPIPTCQ